MKMPKLLGLLTACLLCFALDASAQSSSIFGSGLKRSPKNIYGTKKNSMRSGRAYGDHGVTLRKNYFGNSRASKSSNRQSNETNGNKGATGWDQIYGGSVQQVPRGSQHTPEGWEKF